MKVVSILLFFFVAQNAWSSTFGVVDMQRVILSVSEGKNARAALENEIKGKEGVLKKKKDELDKLNENWKTQAPLLSEQARMEKQQEFQQKFMDLRNEEMQFQSAIKKKEGDATQQIAMKVARIVESMAVARNLDGVFETNSAGLLYLKAPVDLTPDIIKDYDALVVKLGLNQPPQAVKK